MKKFLISFFTLLVCAGCSTAPKAIYTSEIRVCPVKPPNVSCPALEKRKTNLREFLKQWETAKEKHYQCTQSLQVWHETWENCKAGAEIP